MATQKAKLNFLLNGQPISEPDALKKLVAIYGDKRSVADILPGLESGKYSHASVAEGHIAVATETPKA